MIFGVILFLLILSRRWIEFEVELNLEKNIHAFAKNKLVISIYVIQVSGSTIDLVRRIALCMMTRV